MSQYVATAIILTSIISYFWLPPAETIYYFSLM